MLKYGRSQLPITLSEQDLGGKVSRKSTQMDTNKCTGIQELLRTNALIELSVGSALNLSGWMGRQLDIKQNQGAGF
ncbi:hypothetical protein [Candidatus Thiosymbion oneisti]|uniref:hypothetical protein n=1 Tax=Candidatus Thiosymbion oneisti TaxID=589554 RepID=UPI000B7D9332|nr:hypothetical protein [Candidatus Thiosymbion oneisti]